MHSPLDWLRRQSWLTRTIFSAAFASISVGAFFLADRIWPWGIVMAVAPWLFRERSSEEEVFFRPVKATDEKPIAVQGVEVTEHALEKLLGQLSANTTSGFGPDKISSVLTSLGELAAGEEKQFQFVVMFDAKPTSLRLTLRKKQNENLEVEVVSDARLAAALKPGVATETA